MNIFLSLSTVCKYPEKKTVSLVVLLIACMGWTASQAQQTKGLLQLADQYFAAGEYYTAANLYSQYLHPSKKQKPASEFPLNSRRRRTGGTSVNISRMDVLYKQAESYRLANYWQEAATAYKECAEKEPLQYPDALYWQAVCERSLGQYASAKEMLTKYIAAGITYKDAAIKELSTLLYIRQQLARADSILIKVKKIEAANSSVSGVFATAAVSGTRFLISSTQTDSTRVNGVNPYHSRLFSTTLNEGRFESMEPINLPAIDPSINQGAGSLSADGNILYFSQWKYEKGGMVSVIYYSTKQPGGWSTPVLASFINKQGFASKQPFCSADGKYLFFSSDRPGGSGKFDIWYAPLNRDGSTGEPVNAGTNVNTVGDEQAPFYHTSSATLVFSSNGRAGMGGYDLFTSEGSGNSWKLPENLGHPINSSRDDIYFFAKEGASLLSDAIFSSDRGSGCCLETYTISKSPKSKILAGIILNCNDNTPVSGAEVVLKDGTGAKWKTVTGPDGNYLFEIGPGVYPDLSLTINKELYRDTIAAFKEDNIDRSDLLTDKITNAVMCIDKKPVFVIKPEDVVTVFFDFDKSILKPAAVSKLDSIYNVMVEYPVATIQISGYTDGRGTEAYNKVLSDKRAKACADYLAKKGIEASRISFVSFGACCPIEMELINGRDNPDGRSRNRRALINVKKD